MGDEPTPDPATAEECPEDPAATNSAAEASQAEASQAEAIEEKASQAKAAKDRAAARKYRKQAEAKTLPTTEAGEKVADQMRRKLIEMVDSIALVEANRRRGSTIDVPDYEAAFDQIANPSRRQKAVVVVADAAGAIGAALIGYSINIYTGGSRNFQSGNIAMIAGIALSGFGIALKYGVEAR